MASKKSSGTMRGSGAGAGGSEGYSTHGSRYVELEREDSALLQIKKTYWTAKQVMKRKMGRKEDSSVVASDSQLDAKLELFKQIRKSSFVLVRVIEAYQHRLNGLAREEHGMGRFLRGYGNEDHTQAGKMLIAVGKSQGFAAQQRIQLHGPLKRLRAEVETFVSRAIADTQVTVDRMEDARNEYRGALMWMKDVSEQLNPDVYKQMEKFRRVQQEVRQSKARFDRLKLGVLQKVDMLAASRSNMFSHALLGYQTGLLVFWQRTAKTMRVVSDAFTGYQHYEFCMLKELDTPSKELVEMTAPSPVAEDEETPADNAAEDESPPPATNAPKSVSLADDVKQEVTEAPEDKVIRDIRRLLKKPLKKPEHPLKKFQKPRDNATDGDTQEPEDFRSLINFDDDDDDDVDDVDEQEKGDMERGADYNQKRADDVPFGDFQAAPLVEMEEEEEDALGEFASLLQPDRPTGKDDGSLGNPADLLDLLGEGEEEIIPNLASTPTAASSDGGVKTGSYEAADKDGDLATSIVWDTALDDAAVSSLFDTPGIQSPAGLEALSVSSRADSPFSSTTAEDEGDTAHGEESSASFQFLLPSQLLDGKLGTDSGTTSALGQADFADFDDFVGADSSQPNGTSGKDQPEGSQTKEKKTDWLSLFSDLDPLGNPDSSGREDVNAGNA